MSSPLSPQNQFSTSGFDTGTLSSYPLPLSPPLLQSPPHPLDFPLLYHLLMLQNYCHQNYQEFYKDREMTVSDYPPQSIITNDLNEPKNPFSTSGFVTSQHNQQQQQQQHNRLLPDEPLDLSSKSESDSNSVSGFLTEDYKISYDESFKQSEEVEVVHKDNMKDRTVAQLGQKREETVKDFVSRKIKEHRKSESLSEVKRFVSEVNPKEKYIEKKMTRIKKKYCEINNKIRKLDERKLKLKTPSNLPNTKSQLYDTNDDLNIVNDTKDTSIAQNVTKTEPPQPSAIEKEAVKRKLSFDETESIDSDEKEKSDVEVKSDKASKDQDDDHDAQSDSRMIYLDPDNLKDSARVLFLQDAVLHPSRLSVILEPDIYGVKACVNILLFGKKTLK